ncbi:DUF1491 family protein [Aquibium carbonis]|uniref:DUF1491 family protein n=1 Tax=Aquibium carbonis TaxID=2495581 RepID=UPI001FDF89AF|nr:DUF1491 family protein [Aquibium carbonis]
MPRLTSEFFVSALTRRVFNAGGFAAVMRKGSAEAGAIFLVLRGRDGLYRLVGPAPQSGYGDGASDEAKSGHGGETGLGHDTGGRRFAVVAEGLDDEALEKRIEREARFDSDVWFVELDTATPAEDLVALTTP